MAAWLENHNLGNHRLLASSNNHPCLILAKYPANVGVLVARKYCAISETMAPSYGCYSFLESNGIIV
jgi:hypothetical protein